MRSQAMLADLLSRAMREVVIESDPRMGSRVTVEQYRAWMLARTVQRRVDLTPASIRTSPRLAEGDVRRELTDLVSEALSTVIVEGQVLLGAREVLGGLVGPVSISQIVDKLVQLLVVYGPDIAASWFLYAIENPVSAYQSYTLIDGISIEEPIEIFDGVRMFPLPRSSGDLPPHIPEFWGARSGVSDVDILGGTVVEVDCFLSPRFASPSADGDAFLANRQLFRTGVRSSELDDLFVGRLCSALSLASRTTIRHTVTWDHMPFQEVGQTVHPSRGWRSAHRYGDLTCVSLGESIGEVVAGARERYRSMSSASRDLLEAARSPDHAVDGIRI